MSAYLTALLTPATVDAATAVVQQDPATYAVLAATVQRLARVKSGDRVPADDVASVAVLTACALLQDGREPTDAAALAVTTAVRAALRDTLQDADNTGGSLDDVSDNGEPRLRLASPYAPDPAAPYGTTTGDRYARSLASLDGLDGVTAHALTSAEWKGGKVPAAAVRRALDLPPVTGRAGTAWTAAVTADAARILPALQDAYRDALTLDAQGVEGWEPTRTYGAPRRPAVPSRYSATRRTGDTYRMTPRTPDAGDVQRYREQDARPTSGPATAVLTYSRRDADRLGILDGGARRKATDADAAAVTARTLYAPTTAPAHKATGAHREGQSFDAMATDALTGTAPRIVGVSVDADGVAVAGSGVTGRGSSTAPAAQRIVKRGKAKAGSTGPTVPCGPRG